MLKQDKVVIHKLEKYSYIDSPPFHAPLAYPEYLFPDCLEPENHVYDSLRNCLYMLDLDKKNYGTKKWNPLSVIINPGDKVLIKPNLIAEAQRKNNKWEALITNGSLIRAVVDYVYLALKGKGTIIIADAPQEDSDIDAIKEHIGITSIQAFYKKELDFDIQFLDLRDKHLIEKDGVYIDTEYLKGDPLGNIEYDLGNNSYFAEHYGMNKKYYGAYYNIEETNEMHRDGVSKYMISGTAIDADVFISVPKLKTHKKVGVTFNLKSLVGINGQKNWLPHYAIGSPSENGDQFDSSNLRTKMENNFVIKAKEFLLTNNPMVKFLARKLKKVAYNIFGDTEKVVRSGNWYGNDTCWRMVLDLNRILLYGKKNGKLHKKRKRYFSVIEGIIGMEGNGPVAGDAIDCGVITAGFDPVIVDIVASLLIGFDYRKIKMLIRAFDKSDYPLCSCSLDGVQVQSNIKDYNGSLSDIEKAPSLHFAPHFGWKDHIERKINEL